MSNLKRVLTEELGYSEQDAKTILAKSPYYQEAMKMANPTVDMDKVGTIGERLAAKTLLGGKISNGKVDTIYICGYNNTPDENYVLVTTVSVDSIYGMRRNIAQAIDAGIKEALENRPLDGNGIYWKDRFKEMEAERNKLYDEIKQLGQKPVDNNLELIENLKKRIVELEGSVEALMKERGQV